MEEPKDLPVIPPLTEQEKRQLDYPNPNPPVAKCGECKRTIYRMEMYCCMNNYCPLKPQIR